MLSKSVKSYGKACIAYTVGVMNKGEVVAKPRGGPKRIWQRKLLVSMSRDQQTKRVGYIVSISSSSVVCPSQKYKLSNK